MMFAAFHKPYVNLDESVQYCTGCLPSSDYKKAVYAVYQPELTVWLSKNSYDYHKPPPHNPNCTAKFAEGGPVILSPSEDYEYFLERNSGQGILLLAASDSRVKTHYWYVNEKFIRKTKPGERLFYVPEEAVSAEQYVQQSDRDSLYIVMNYAKDHYKDLLFNSEEGKSIGLSYFRERGFNDRTIEKFELGYSINEWDNFNKKAITARYSEEMLEKAGLIIRKEGGRFYDRFRGRVIFPVHNLAGKVIAFGARILTKEKDQPKYINSPETEIYHKSNVLYGIFQAKNAIRREDFCYLVEGYTDVISLHQSDVDNVVASSGTALTEEQIIPEIVQLVRVGEALWQTTPVR